MKVKQKIERSSSGLRRAAPRVLSLAAALAAMSAQAGVVPLDNGMELQWGLEASLTEGWRTQAPDMSLLGPLVGGTNSTDTGDSANLNWPKHSNFSNLLRVIGEVKIHKGDTGVFARAKAWDNFALSNGTVPLGSVSNSFIANSALSDGQFDTSLSKFSGVELLDLYGFTRFKLSDNVSGDVKFGQLATNWGESLFVPGVSGYSLFDVTALRQPGTLLKEAILPVPQVAASFELPNGFQAEAFYQFQSKKMVIDSCGTYWSPSLTLNCTNGTISVAQYIPAFGLTTLQGQTIGNPANVGKPNTMFQKAPDSEAPNDGQFGLSIKKTVDKLDTEFGAYYVQYHSRIPMLSAHRSTTPSPAGSIWNSVGGGNLGDAFWNYDTGMIKTLGLSASTVLGGWAVAGEVSYAKDMPAMVNPIDLFNAVVSQVGPLAARDPGKGTGEELRGWDLKNKTQLNISTIKSFGGVLGSNSMVLVGEAAFQHWSGIGDPYTSVRYGRGFEYGAGASVFYGGCPAAVQKVAANCTEDGYATPNSWGVRVKAEFEYPGVIANATLRPRVFFAKDIKGWSADGTFNEGRTTLSLGAKVDFHQKYYVDLSYTTYADSARFDNFHDRDYVGLVFGASF